MAYLSLEKETCFFSGGVSAFPSPGKLKFGHCVCLSLTRGAGSAAELSTASLGQRVCYTNLGDRSGSILILLIWSSWAGLGRCILNYLEQYFLGKKMDKGFFS